MSYLMTMSHNNSPEKVGHNELLELSETTKDIEMRLKDVMKSCRAETTPKSLESCYFSTPKPSDPKVPLFSRPREVTASYDPRFEFSPSRLRDRDEVFDRNVRNTGSVTDPSFLVTPNRPEPRYEPMLGTTGSAYDPTILNTPSPIGRSGYTNPRQVTFQDSRQEFQIAPGHSHSTQTDFPPNWYPSYSVPIQTHAPLHTKWLNQINLTPIPLNGQITWHIFNMLHTGIGGMTVRKRNA